MPDESSITSKTQYHKLNTYVLLFDPLISAIAAATDPSVILVFGWLDGQLKHLLKYVDPLRAAYPASLLVLVKSDFSFYSTSQKQLEEYLIPVADVLRREMSGENPFRGVLIHVFSNGGGFQLMTLRKVLTKMPLQDTPPTPLPTALVLDSVPGEGTLDTVITLTAPNNGLLRLLAIPVITLLYFVFVVVNALGGHPPIFSELRSALNAPDILPALTSAATPRLYLYSSADKLVRAPWIEAHIDDARRMKLNVTVEKFSSPHVAHARSDPERYWGAVRRLWNRAVEDVASHGLK